MKINVKQPKYIIPLLILPFVLLFYYQFGTGGGKTKTAANAADSTKMFGQLNPGLPGVSSEVAKQDIRDKFGAYQEAYKQAERNSALGGLDLLTTGNNGAAGNTQKKLDSLQAVLQQNKANLSRQLAGLSQPGRQNNQSADEQQQAFLAKLQSLQRGEGTAPKSALQTTAADTYQDRMKLFREQVRMMDSMQKANTRPSLNDSTRPSWPLKDTTFKPLHVSSVPPARDGFNTVRGAKSENAIRAIIDEDVKARAGTRIRLKLLTDIYAGENLIPKGTYIYGFVSGFQAQRVNVTIKQVMLNNTAMPVILDVYDNDGYIGLDVPGSDFREFTKDVGTAGTQGLSGVNQASDGGLTSTLANALIQTTTSTATKLIQRDKAFLKYGYFVFLQERPGQKTN